MDCEENHHVYRPKGVGYAIKFSKRGGHTKWIHKTYELEPGDTVDITKETKKYVKTFKEFRFVRRIVDKTLVRSGISLFDPEDDIEYKIEG